MADGSRYFVRRRMNVRAWQIKKLPYRERPEAVRDLLGQIKRFLRDVQKDCANE